MDWSNVRRWLGISDQNGGLDPVSVFLLVVTLGLATWAGYVFWTVPVTRLPDAGVTWEVEELVESVCVGDPLSYSASVRFEKTIVIERAVHAVVSRSTFFTVYQIPTTIEEGTVRVAGDERPMAAFVHSLPDLPPGLYSARFALVVSSHDPAVRVIDFQVIDCSEAASGRE